MPAKNERQTLLFSATFSNEIQKIVKETLSDNYLLVTHNVEDYVANDNIEQQFFYIEEKDKPYQLHYLLQQCKGSCIGK